MASPAVKHGVEMARGSESGPAGQERPERHVFVVCTGEECLHAGSEALLSELHHRCHHTSADVRVGASGCLGHCQLAPAMMEDGRMLGWVSPQRLRSELSRLGIAG